MATKRQEITKTIMADMETRTLPAKKGATDDRKPQDKGSMAIFSIRLPESQKSKLQAHLKADLGLDLSPGIRMIITQYMKEHRL